MAKTAEPAPRRRGMWHGLWTSLLIGLGVPALVLLIVAGAWLNRTTLAEWALETAAAAGGAGPAQLKIERLEPTALEIVDVRLGETIAVERVTVTFRPTDLLDGKVDEIRATGLTITPEPTDGDNSFDLFQYLSDGGGTVPVIPFRRLILEKSQLHLGDTLVTAEAEVSTVSPNQIELTAASLIVGPEASGAISAAGTVHNEDGVLSANLRFIPRGQVRDVAGEGDVSFLVALDRSGSAKGTISIDSLHAEQNAATPAALGNATGSIEFTASGNGLERLSGELALFDIAAAGRTFPQIPVQLSLEDNLVSLAAQLDAPEIGLEITIGGVLQELRNRISFDVSGNIFPRYLPLPAEVSAHGRVQFSVAGQVSEPMLLATLPHTDWMKFLAIDGQAELDLRGLHYAKAFAADTLRGPLVWSLRDNTLLIDAAKGLSAEIRVPEQLIGRFGDLVPDTVAIRLGGPGATPPSLSLTPSDDGWNIALATGASVPSLNVSAETDLRLDLDQAFRLRELAIPFLLAEITSLAPFGLDGTAEITAINVAGDLRNASAEISGRATIATWQDNGLRADGLRAELDATVVWQDENLAVRLGPSTRVSLDSLARDSINIGPTALGLDPAAPGSFTIGTDGSLTYDLSLAPFTAKISAPAGPIEADLRRLHLTGSKKDAAITFTAANVTAATRDIVASDVAGSLEIERNGRAAWTMEIGNVAQTGADSWLSAVAVELTGTRSAGGKLGFDVHLTKPAAGLDLRAQGAHDVSAKRGTAEIAMAPLSFSAGGPQPADISPRLGDLLTDVSGGLRAGGTIAWRDNIVESDLAITLDKLDLKADRLDIQDLTGDLRITGLRPPATAADQTLAFAVRQGQLGALPIDVTFQLQPDGQLDVTSFTVEAMGGRIRANDMTIATADPFPVETTLLVEDVDLEQLLALTNVEGLTGSGRLSGQIPLRLEDGKVAINGGTLAAAGSGTVQFNRAKLPAALLAKGDIVSIALETLTDFNYDSLDMQISKSLQGDGVVKVQLAGANPDVLDGHPFNFNIAFESDFDRLAKLVTEGLAVADTALFNAAGGAAR